MLFRERKPLKLNTELRVINHEGAELLYVIDKVIGFGGSCIVYEGHYFNTVGNAKTVRIKECYPYKLHINRSETNFLIIQDNEEDKFDEYKSRMKNSFVVAHRLHETNGMINSTSDLLDMYEANGTVYIVTSCTEGNILSEYQCMDLENAVRIVTSVAKAIEKIHEAGYLYLDIKPENILAYSETPDLVQLFDFDSMIPIGVHDEITKYRISYTVGFAPIEQKMGNLSQIGKYTDVYSIGALLFYLIFARIPNAADYGLDVKYEYSSMVWNCIYQKRAYKELNIFFNKTLQAYSKDRYQSMNDVISQLQEILKYASMPVPFICSGFVSNQGQIIGRDNECKKLLQWYQGNEKLIFVTGMGGIGKSTIVRKFISDNDECFDNVIYLKYKASIYETFSDDVRFCINGCEKDAEESLDEYFIRKLKSARDLIKDSSTLLIIDNFDSNIDKIFLQLLDIEWKIIVITRQDMSDSGYMCYKAEKLADKKEMYKLFENNIGHKLKADEYDKLDSIIELAAGHTLTLVLIAKQLSKSYFSLDEAYTLLSENGFFDRVSEKIEYMQDGELFYDKVSKIIRTIYDMSTVSENKRKYLKVLSVFGSTGLDIKEYKELLQLKSLDEINELEVLGWLEVSDNLVQMHPLVQETIQQFEWSDESRIIIINKMKHLFKQIKMYDEYTKNSSDKAVSNEGNSDIYNG